MKFIPKDSEILTKKDQQRLPLAKNKLQNDKRSKETDI